MYMYIVNIYKIERSKTTKWNSVCFKMVSSNNRKQEFVRKCHKNTYWIGAQKAYHIKVSEEFFLMLRKKDWLKNWIGKSRSRYKLEYNTIYNTVNHWYCKPQVYKTLDFTNLFPFVLLQQSLINPYHITIFRYNNFYFTFAFEVRQIESLVYSISKPLFHSTHHKTY